MFHIRTNDTLKSIHVLILLMRYVISFVGNWCTSTRIFQVHKNVIRIGSEF